MARPLRRNAGLAAGMLLLVATLAVVGWSQPAAALDAPVFTGGQVAAPYAGVASQPSIASSGTQALVVWHERVGTTNTWGIFGRITNATTTTIGPKLTISFVEGRSSMYPDVAWNGSNWLVVWHYAYSGTDSDIRSAMVSPSGAVGSTIQIEGNGSHQFYPAVTAGADGEFVVVWEDKRNPTTTLSDIYSKRVTGTGVVDNKYAYRLSYDLVGIETADTDPDIAWFEELDTYGLVYVVTGNNHSAVRYRDFTQKYGDPTFVYTGHEIVSKTSTYPVSKPALASSGRDVLIAYQEETPSGFQINAVMLGNNGEATIPISTAVGHQTFPTVAFNGTFMVAWKDGRTDGGGDIYGARVKKDRTVLDPNGFLITEYTPADEYPALGKGAKKAGTFTIAWNAWPTGEAGTGIPVFGIDSKAPK